MQRHRMRRVVVLVGVAMALCCAKASASGVIWSTYNLSAEVGGQQVTGRPSLLTDPNNPSGSEVAINSPSASTLQFDGDGSGEPAVYSPSADTNIGGNENDAAGIADPATGDFLIFTELTNGNLEEYDRNSHSYVWNAYDISTIAGGQTIGSDPSVAPQSTGYSNPFVAANDGNGNLVVFSRANGGGWTSTNVSSATNQPITGNPVAFLDPGGDYPDVMAQGPGGHLIQFADEGGTWYAFDFTASFGGQTITGDPTVATVPGTSQLVAFTEAPGGDLIQWTRNSTGGWAPLNLTTLTGGRTLASSPAVTVDTTDNQFTVVAQGAGEHLIEYTGLGNSWSDDDLTADEGGPTINGVPAAEMSPSTHNLVIFATSAAGNLVEMERSPASGASSGSGDSSGSSSSGGLSGSGSGSSGSSAGRQGTSTVTPSPSKPGSLKSVRVKVTFEWRWSRTASRLMKFGLGRLVTGSGLSVRCYGKGCPFHLAVASGRHIGALEKRLAGSLFRVGDKLDITITEPGRKAERVRATVRAKRQPLLALL